jgi:hypothetical protein
MNAAHEPLVGGKKGSHRHLVSPFVFFCQVILALYPRHRHCGMRRRAPPYLILTGESHLHRHHHTYFMPQPPPDRDPLPSATCYAIVSSFPWRGSPPCLLTNHRKTTHASFQAPHLDYLSAPKAGEGGRICTSVRPKTCFEQYQIYNVKMVLDWINDSQGGDFIPITQNFAVDLVKERSLELKRRMVGRSLGRSVRFGEARPCRAAQMKNGEPQYAGITWMLDAEQAPLKIELTHPVSVLLFFII